MGFVGKAHHCDLPEATRAMWVGETVWECDYCRQHWIAVLMWDPERKQPGKFFKGGHFPGWSEYDGVVE